MKTIENKKYRSVAKLIRIIESCNKFEQLKMTYNYWLLVNKRFDNIAKYGNEYFDDVNIAYINKYSELELEDK